MLIPLLLGACHSAAPALVEISADRRLAEVAGACAVRYEKDGPITTVQPEPGKGLSVVTETWLTERYQLERALRLRVEQLSGAELAPVKVPAP